ncbi:FirrV-1-E4 precursor [Feldmannia irregularis virus a]|uniref:FirrV-1-E4 n=1 Tax=Feldmannia irregularis virus a TaxID=231992 RepID=Q6XLV8_9PHYC|nr:FirrV-1-E4 precursor [Feldmannia irregularis virus a]AAR26953.1 FirrV-1-E4 precursor [Feldmannia irregularis virus a]
MKRVLHLLLFASTVTLAGYPATHITKQVAPHVLPKHLQYNYKFMMYLSLFVAGIITYISVVQLRLLKH